jgi:hypothetical protein
MNFKTCDDYYDECVLELRSLLSVCFTFHYLKNGDELS